MHSTKRALYLYTANLTDKLKIMNDEQFRALIEASEVFKAFAPYKQNIFLQPQVRARLKVLYGQAERLGIEYIKQNPTLTYSDINLIQSMLC